MPGLKLRVRGMEDLSVVSALVQDAIISVAELAWLREDRQFVLIANRFRWEDQAAAGPTPDAGDESPRHFRVLSALRFFGVSRVALRHLDLRQRGRFLNLLAVESWAQGIVLRCADHADIRLTCPRPDAILEDLGEPWPAGQHPHHPEVLTE